MATLLMLICMMAGALLGLRFKVFILVPASLLVAAVTIVGGIVSGHAIGLVALVTYGTIASLQIGYLAACMFLEYFPYEPRDHLPRSSRSVAAEHDPG
jgi:hypothetical protein